MQITEIGQCRHGARARVVLGLGERARIIHGRLYLEPRSGVFFLHNQERRQGAFPIDIEAYQVAARLWRLPYSYGIFNRNGLPRDGWRDLVMDDRDIDLPGMDRILGQRMMAPAEVVEKPGERRYDGSLYTKDAIDGKSLDSFKERVARARARAADSGNRAEQVRQIDTAARLEYKLAVHRKFFP